MKVDIAVIGGGMVGAAAALALAQSGFVVAVVEPSQPPALADVAPCETRVSALTLASQSFLAQLDVWQPLQAWGVQPFTAMHVWSDDTTGEVVFRAEEAGVTALGWVIPNRAIQAVLWQALQTHPQVHCLPGRGLEAIEGEQVRLSDGSMVRARLLVGADGACSSVRALASIPLDTHEYGQAAIVGCLRTQQSHENACWQRYTADGPVAFLAMADHIISLAWYLPMDKLEWALSLSDEAFAAAVAQAAGYRLGEIEWVGERAGFPLVRRHAQRYFKGNVVLVGDAAHTIHPQAGQGVNLGFLDVMALREVLNSARQAGMDWAAEAVLRRYQRRRYGDNLLVQRAMDGFDALFAHDLPWKRPLRQGTLTLGRLLPPARHLLMDLALFGRMR